MAKKEKRPVFHNKLGYFLELNILHLSSWEIVIIRKLAKFCSIFNYN